MQTRTQRESKTRHSKKKPQKIVTPKETEEKKQTGLKKQRESNARHRKSKTAGVELTPAEKREKQLQQRLNFDARKRASFKHLSVTIKNDFGHCSWHHQQMEAVQAPTWNNSNDSRTFVTDQSAPQARPHIQSKQPPPLKTNLDKRSQS
jgi:hypothetical protein